MEQRKRMLNHMNTKKNILSNRINRKQNKIINQRETDMMSRYLELTHLKALSKK